MERKGKGRIFNSMKRISRYNIPSGRIGNWKEIRRVRAQSVGWDEIKVKGSYG